MICESLQPGRAEWLLRRQLCIGATNIAAIVNLHPHETEYGVWEDKTGRSEPKPMNDEMERGLFFEPWVAKKYRDITGNEIRRHGRLVLHPDYPELGCTPDYYVLNTDRLLECKTAGRWSARGFGEDGSDQVPDWYLTQCQWQMTITGRKWVDLALLVDIDTVRLFSIPFDEDLSTYLIRRARQWWETHVVKDIPPPISGHKADTERVKARYREDNGEEIACGFEQSEEIAKLIRLRKQIKEIEAEADQIENRVKMYMADASVLHADGAMITWKQNKPSVRTDWKSAASEANVPAEIITKHTRTEPGARVFKIKEL